MGESEKLRAALADLDRIERHVRWAGAPIESIRAALFERELLTQKEIRWQRVAMARQVIAAFKCAVAFGDTAEEAIATVHQLLGLGDEPSKDKTDV